MTATPKPLKTILCTFVNTLYMSHKQFGIQTAHMMGALAHKYYVELADDPKCKGRAILSEYLGNPEPFIFMLDGMCVERLGELGVFIDRWASALDLPRGSFYESKAALNGALTCVGFVKPTDLFWPERPLINVPTDEFLQLSEQDVRELCRPLSDINLSPPVGATERSLMMMHELISRSRFAN